MRDYYDEMSRGGLQHPKGYGATLGQWMELTGKGYDHEKDSGWKFKVSVAHDDVPKAWNIVADILLNQNIPQAASVATPSRLDQIRQTESAGKTIVIDTNRDVGTARYMMLMNHIDQELRKAGIKPADPQPDDRAVQNSPYLSYGWDLPAKGVYNPDAVQKKLHNPSTQTDPYADFKVDGEPKKPRPTQRQFPPMLPADSKEKEYMRHHWHDASNCNGAPVVRLPILGMEGQRVIRIQQELVEAGLCFEFSESEELGPVTLKLTGDDARLFRKINPAVPHFLRHQWRSAQDTTGQAVTRLPLAGLSEIERVRVLVGLHESGFKPAEHNSATLGKTLRLTGADAERLGQMKNKLPSILHTPA